MLKPDTFAGSVRILEHFSPGSLVVIAITFVLFAVALFTKGLVHGLLLEAAIFLVSVKLMLMIYRNSIAAGSLEKRLDRIDEALHRIERYDRGRS